MLIFPRYFCDLKMWIFCLRSRRINTPNLRVIGVAAGVETVTMAQEAVPVVTGVTLTQATTGALRI
jgi:hypothetical protein